MEYIIKVNGKSWDDLSDEEKNKLKIHMLNSFKKHCGLIIDTKSKDKR